MKLVKTFLGCRCDVRVSGGICLKPAVVHDEDGPDWKMPAFFCEEHKPTDEEAPNG